MKELRSRWRPDSCACSRSFVLSRHSQFRIHFEHEETFEHNLSECILSKANDDQDAAQI